jgi:hydrophobic/amphiphilic exporter-1 (mainly G- bacteria), HAE1 family
MGGIIGRIFNEFAAVVTMAIAASAFISLTLTPMLAAKMLKPPQRDERENRVIVLFERGFNALTRGYDRTLQVSLRYQPVVLLVFFAPLAATVWLLFITPKGFFPQEDIGQLSVSTEARQDISFDAMVALQQRVADVIRGSPHVANVASIVGSSGQSSGLNTGRMFVELKPREQRRELQRVLADLRAQIARIPGINAYATPVQNIRIGGRASRAEYQFVMQSLDRDQLYEWSQRMADAMGATRVLQMSTATCRSMPPKRPW